MTRALISTSDKTGIADLARVLVESGVEIVSTGGTARHLADAGVPVTDVSQVTGFPEIMDGRVKTLHPAVHAGVLARRDDDGHMAALASLGIAPIDYVIVNLYPFAETVAAGDVDIDAATEQVDVGGPTMLRAAAKNWRHVAVVVDPSDYATIANDAHARSHAATVPLPGTGPEGTAAPGTLGDDDRLALAAKAFRHTAAYDAVIAGHFTAAVAGPDTDRDFPDTLTLTFAKRDDLRYGENPHQGAAFYAEPFAGPGTIAGAVQLAGKQLSYNNIGDADAALALLADLGDRPAAVVVKHANPCGVARGETIAQAWLAAHDADPVSVFGGIVALNRTVDAETARSLREVFLEIVIAPAFDDDALEVLREKPNLRLLTVAMDGVDGASPAGAAEEADGAGVALAAPPRSGRSRTISHVSGGLLVQNADARTLDLATDGEVVTAAAPTPDHLRDLDLAWTVVKHVRSNAIVVVKDGRTVGIGAGQMNRVGAARIALEQAGELARGAALASDAFFPMPDTVEAAAAAGIAAIVQPGGSVRDADSIAAADAAGAAMVLTGVRHFRH